eukprot:GHVU01151179.1.p1 GENE.GHVU01151179.1~~GHVU01151179.1.p1  ORF type:complete len:343 (+),score=65.78 GHVU01151179.1:325-1353(+)
MNGEASIAIGNRLLNLSLLLVASLLCHKGCEAGWSGRAASRFSERPCGRRRGCASGRREYAAPATVGAASAGVLGGLMRLPSFKPLEAASAIEGGGEGSYSRGGVHDTPSTSRYFQSSVSPRQHGDSSSGGDGDGVGGGERQQPQRAHEDPAGVKLPFAVVERTAESGGLYGWQAAVVLAGVATPPHARLSLQDSLLCSDNRADEVAAARGEAVGDLAHFHFQKDSDEHWMRTLTLCLRDKAPPHGYTTAVGHITIPDGCQRDEDGDCHRPVVQMAGTPTATEESPRLLRRASSRRPAAAAAAAAASGSSSSSSSSSAVELRVELPFTPEALDALPPATIFA